MNNKLMAILTEALGEYIEMLKSRANLMSNGVQESDSKIKELEEKLNELGIENESLKSKLESEAKSEYGSALKTKELSYSLTYNEATIVNAMYLMGHWATSSEIGKATNVNLGTCKNLLTNLCRKGLLRSKKAPNSKNKKLYKHAAL